MAGRAGHSHRRWRISAKKAKIDHVRNDINVTPLVDVMLVLLIIFMLMTLVMGRGHDVALPKAHNYSSKKDHMQPVISVDLEGDIWIEKDHLGPPDEKNLREMENRIKAAWDAPKNPEGVGHVYLKADDQLEYIKVYPVLVRLNKGVLAMQSVDLAIAKDSEKK